MAKANSEILQNAGPLLRGLVAAQRLEEQAARYPQIEQWADVLILCARRCEGCVVWPVGASAERIVGVATSRSHGALDVGFWDTPLAGRSVLLFAVAGVTPVSLTLVAEQLRRRGAAEVHACGVAVEGAGNAEGLNSFRSLSTEGVRLSRAAA